MDEPRTAAGRALLAWADELRPFGSDEHVLSPASVARIEDGIAAIEREAAEAARAEVAEPRPPCICGEPRMVAGKCYTAEGERTGHWPRAEVAEPGDGRDPARAFTRWFLMQPYHRQKAFVDDWLSSARAATAGREPLDALREQFVALAPPAVVSRIAVWRLLGGSDDDMPWAARAEVAEPDRCGVALSCLLAPRHEGRHVSPDGASWAYGLAIAAPAGREPLDALREAAMVAVMSWFGATESEMPIHDAMVDLRAALDTPGPGTP